MYSFLKHKFLDISKQILEIAKKFVDIFRNFYDIFEIPKKCLRTFEDFLEFS